MTRSIFTLAHLLAPVLLFSSLSVPVANADWRAATPAVTEAALDPEIAAVLAAVTEMDVALTTKNVSAFVGRFTPDVVINGPNNMIGGRDMAAGALASGTINYYAITRSIEFAGKRANGEVVLMGEETFRPRAPHPLAEKTARRRFTDVWTKTPEGWRLSLRQATIFEVR